MFPFYLAVAWLDSGSCPVVGTLGRLSSPLAAALPVRPKLAGPLCALIGPRVHPRRTARLFHPTRKIILVNPKIIVDMIVSCAYIGPHGGYDNDRSHRIENES